MKNFIYYFNTEKIHKKTQECYRNLSENEKIKKRGNMLTTEIKMCQTWIEEEGKNT